MRVGVVGAGGVGGYFAVRLAAAGNDVRVLARGDHLDAIRSRGLRLRSVLGDAHAHLTAAEVPAELGVCDLVLFCVKAYDTAPAARLLGPLLGEQTPVLSLQNGVDNEEALAEVVGPERVLGGAAYIFSTISEPGLVAHTGGPARILLGELDGTRTERVERLLAVLADAGIDADAPADIRVALWSKLAFICATAGMTAAVRLPMGDIRGCDQSWGLFRQIVDEVVRLAQAEQIPLPPDTAEQVIGLAQQLDPGSYSSLHHDLVTGHRMELDALHGSVVRRAGRFGVDVPGCTAVHAILSPWAQRNGR